jgi:hypothetical protein
MLSPVGMTSGLLLLPALVLSCVAAYADSVTITDPRPVAKAIEQIESRYGWPATYEDPPYVHESQMLDVTAVVRSGRQEADTAGASNRVLIPRGGTVSFEYDEKPSVLGLNPPSLATLNALTHLLKSYSGSVDGLEMFRVIQSGKAFHVVPTRYVNPLGQPAEIKPLLDVPVTISPGDRKTAATLINDVCVSLSVTTGQTVVLGSAPSFLMKVTMSIAAANEAARSVLDRIFAEIDTPLSWDLFYDPGLRWYGLNVHVVREATQQ